MMKNFRLTLKTTLGSETPVVSYMEAGGYENPECLARRVVYTAHLNFVNHAGSDDNPYADQFHATCHMIHERNLYETFVEVMEVTEDKEPTIYEMLRGWFHV